MVMSCLPGGVLRRIGSTGCAAGQRTTSSLANPRMREGQWLKRRQTAAEITCHISQSMTAGVKCCHSGGRQVTAHGEQHVIWQLQQQAPSIVRWLVGTLRSALCWFAGCATLCQALRHDSAACSAAAFLQISGEGWLSACPSPTCASAVCKEGLRVSCSTDRGCHLPLHLAARCCEAGMPRWGPANTSLNSKRHDPASHEAQQSLAI